MEATTPLTVMFFKKNTSNVSVGYFKLRDWKPSWMGIFESSKVQADDTTALLVVNFFVSQNDVCEIKILWNDPA